MGTSLYADEQQFSDNEIIDSIAMEDAIAQLTERQQAVIGLRMMGFTQDDITKLLAVSRTTVWVDENEALAQLKNILGGDSD